MGACRETQDIFKLIKWKNYKRAWHLIKHFDKTTYGDTFGPPLCKVFGHKPYHHDYFDEGEYACKRCNRYIDFNPRLEKLKKLKKLNEK